MNKVWMTLTLALLTSQAVAQDYGQQYTQGYGQQYTQDYGQEYSQQYGSQYVQDYGPQNGQQYAQEYGQEYIGSPTPSASEPLYRYDDQEVWKHGWIQINPYEHGYHSYRPYNYKHVFSQSAQAGKWGMPSTMPYSQSYYLRHGNLTGINGEALPNGAAPGDHASPSDGPGYSPQPSFGPTPSYNAPQYGAPAYPTPGHGMPTSMNAPSPLRDQPFNTNAAPQDYNNIAGLTQLPGHQFPPQQQRPQYDPNQGQYPNQFNGYQAQPQSISPANFQQYHQNAASASGPEYQRQQMQKAQIQQLLQQNQMQQQGPSFR